MCKLMTYIPGEDDENRSNGDLADEPLEALLRLSICILEDLITDLQQILGPFDGSGHFLGGVGNGATHLDCELHAQIILLLAEELQRLFDDYLSVGQLSIAPSPEGLGSDLRELLELFSRDAITDEDGLVGGGGNGSDHFDRHGAEQVDGVKCMMYMCCVVCSEVEREDENCQWNFQVTKPIDIIGEVQTTIPPLPAAYKCSICPSIDDLPPGLRPRQSDKISFSGAIIGKGAV